MRARACRGGWPKSASQTKLLDALSGTFGIERPVRRVEIYDNSHIMGSNAIGAMVVAGVDGFMKQHYRTFNIKGEDITPGDDFGMMREVLRRRFARLAKEEAENEGPGESPTAARCGLLTPALAPHAGRGGTIPTCAITRTRARSRSIMAPRPAIRRHRTLFPSRPDLVLIDGGAGQLAAARETLDSLGIRDIALIGIAKGADRTSGRETFFVPGRDPFRLPPRDPALYFVQRLRDEAHRFAIGTHRARRKKDFTKSPLDEIGGIGPVRKRALLNAFGTAKALSRASLGDPGKSAGNQCGHGAARL